jgi:hypothetical protein
VSRVVPERRRRRRVEELLPPKEEKVKQIEAITSTNERAHPRATFISKSLISEAWNQARHLNSEHRHRKWGFKFSFKTQPRTFLPRICTHFLP